MIEITLSDTLDWTLLREDCDHLQVPLQRDTTLSRMQKAKRIFSTHISSFFTFSIVCLRHKEFFLLFSTVFMATAKEHKAIKQSLPTDIFFTQTLAIQNKQCRKQLCNVVRQAGSLGSQDSSCKSLADTSQLI